MSKSRENLYALCVWIIIVGAMICSVTLWRDPVRAIMEVYHDVIANAGIILLGIVCSSLWEYRHPLSKDDTLVDGALSRPLTILVCFAIPTLSLSLASWLFQADVNLLGKAGQWRFFLAFIVILIGIMLSAFIVFRYMLKDSIRLRRDRPGRLLGLGYLTMLIGIVLWFSAVFDAPAEFYSSDKFCYHEWLIFIALIIMFLGVNLQRMAKVELSV